MLKAFMNLRIQFRLLMLLIPFIIGFLIFAVSLFQVMNTVKVNGPVYEKIAQGKDLMADILPPPEFIIEPYLSVLEIEADNDPEKIQYFVDNERHYRKVYEDNHKFWEKNLPEGTIKTILIRDSFQQAEDFFDILEKKVIPLIQAGDKENAHLFISGILKSKYLAHWAKINQVITLLSTESKKIETEAADYVSGNTVRMILTGGIIFVFVIAFSFLIAWTIISPLRKLTNALPAITGGDFTKKIEIHSRDETGILSEAFNKLLVQLNGDLIRVEKSSEKIQETSGQSTEIVNQSVKLIEAVGSNVRDIEIHVDRSTSGVEVLMSTLEEISRNIDEITANMIRQSSSVEEEASSIEEMVRNIQKTASMSNKSHEISNSLNQLALEGGTAVKNSVLSIKEAAENSNRILELLKIITNIAEQTNMLAMNAAIESAHAGEAGKGFSIVASEIRTLSEDTNKNTKDINDAVHSILSRIDESVKLAEKAGSGLESIIDYSRQNEEIVKQLNIAMVEQDNGSKDILRATEELVRITEEVKLAMAEQKKATSEFAGSLREIRDQTLSNRGSIKEHVENLHNLLSVMEKSKELIEENKNQANVLRGLVDKFMLEDKGTV